MAQTSRCLADRSPEAGTPCFSNAPHTDFKEAFQQHEPFSSLSGKEMNQPSLPPTALHAQDAPLRQKASIFPEPFASRLRGRAVQPLGEIFGLKNFGVNLATLTPGALSAPRHAHSRQDEFVYVLAGQPTLVTDTGETQLEPGMCTGFPAGTGNAHMIVNRTDTACVYLVVGDRSAGDALIFPDDDLVAGNAPDGTRRFSHKDGTPYS